MFFWNVTQSFATSMCMCAGNIEITISAFWISAWRWASLLMSSAMAVAFGWLLVLRCANSNDKSPMVRCTFFSLDLFKRYCIRDDAERPAPIIKICLMRLFVVGHKCMNLILTKKPIVSDGLSFILNLRVLRV